MPNPIMRKIAKFIVEKRAFIFLVFIAILIFCALSINKVKVNPDLAALLPEDTVTQRGVEIMKDEFGAFSYADVMISNVTYEKAEEIHKAISDTEGITGVLFDDTT
ncbi:MAG: RND transporter, partial [Parasporobacterium sp.]|nr:RND transporter [Parasporobacterium sp.]